MAAVRPRESHEHLLGTHASIPSSSRAASLYSYSDSIDSRLNSDAAYPSYPKHTGPQPYRGFPSREAYLAALREWAEAKTYQEPHKQTLTGFYGKNTMEYYRSLPKLKGDRAARKEAAARSRRNTVANSVPAAIPEETGPATKTVTNDSLAGIFEEPDNPPKESRRRRLSKVFTGGRRATVG